MNERQKHDLYQDRRPLVAASLAVAVMVAVGAVLSLPGFSGIAISGYDAMYGAMVYMAELCKF